MIAIVNARLEVVIELGDHDGGGGGGGAAACAESDGDIGAARDEDIVGGGVDFELVEGFIVGAGVGVDDVSADVVIGAVDADA